MLCGQPSWYSCSKEGSVLILKCSVPAVQSMNVWDRRNEQGISNFWRRFSKLLGRVVQCLMNGRAAAMNARRGGWEKQKKVVKWRTRLESSIKSPAPILSTSPLRQWACPPPLPALDGGGVGISGWPGLIIVNSTSKVQMCRLTYNQQQWRWKGGARPMKSIKAHPPVSQWFSLLSILLEMNTFWLSVNTN